MHTVYRMLLSDSRYFVFITFAIAYFLTGIVSSAELPPYVLSVFTDNCIRCHGGLEPDSNLNLEETVLIAQTIGKPSSQQPDIVLIKPGQPDISYLVMKITEAPGISGRRMPPFGTFSQESIEIISNWIASLPPNQPPYQSQNDLGLSFYDITIGNSPTTNVLPAKSWYIRISHRFEAAINEGYSSFYGFDGPAIMMLTIGGAITDNLTMSLGRSNAGDAVEWSTRYRICDKTLNGKPFSLSLQTTLGWETEDNNTRDRYSKEAFSFAVHIPVASHVIQNGILVLTPGMLMNPDTSVSDEDILLVLGIAGKYKLGNGYALIGDFTPILSGFASLKSAYGFYDEYRRYDSWTLGLEKTTVSHVFQLFVTNAEGIAAAQSMNGGDLTIQDGEMRFGFEIYRLFR